MSITLAQVITAIRLKHPAFDESRVPSPHLASVLSDFQNTLVGKATQRDKGFCALSTTIALNNTVFASGSPLPANQNVLGGSVLYTDDATNPDELHFTTFERRFDPPEFPAVYIINNTVYLTGRQEDWTDVASITLNYQPIIAALTALNNTFTIPDGAKPCLVAYGAFEAAIRASALGAKVDVGMFNSLYQASENDFLRTLRLKKRAQHNVTRPVEY